MTIASATLSKLAIVIPMLGSDQPGEVQATVAAITRILRAAGADWHDLSAALTAPAAPVPPPPADGDVAAACLFCLRSAVEWTFAEAAFLSSLPRFRRCSGRQKAWLKALLARAQAASPEEAPSRPQPPPRPRKPRKPRSRPKPPPPGCDPPPF